MVVQQEFSEKIEVQSYNERAGEIFMARHEASGWLSAMTKDESDLWEMGQREYAREENVFGNFVRLAAALNLKPEEILLVYAIKHLDGIIAWVNGHESKRENVRGRISDLRVYLAILFLMVEAYDDAPATD